MADRVNNVRFRLRVEAEGQAQAEKLASSVDKVGDNADKSQKELDDLDRKLKGTGSSMKGAGDRATETGNRLKRMGSDADQAGARVATLGQRIKGAATNFLAFAGIDATVRGAFQLVESGLGTIADFEQEVAALSSITGATGGDLDFLKEKAKEVSKVSTVSAVDAVRAFKAIGSARPDLLQSKEALAAVTKEAIALAEAAEISLEDSGRAVASTLNQWGLAAGDASRVVNVLAAGSLAGAADINTLNVSIEKVGTVMASNNVPLEQGVALLETLAEKSIDGAVAGTQLRGTILKLAQEGKGFVNGQFNIVEALKQTKKEMDGITDPAKRAEAAVKLFGLENVTAGNILLDNIDRIQYFQKAVTGTNTAYEQQRVNTETVNAALQRLRNAWANVVLAFEGSAGPLRRVLDFFARNLQTILKLIVTLTAGIIGYVAASKAAAVATAAWRASVVASRIAFMLLTGQVTAAKTAMQGFNVAVKANPIGLVIGLLTTAATAFGLFSEEADEAAEKTREAAEAQKELNKQLRETLEAERRVNDTREKTRKNADSASTEDVREAIDAVRKELDALKEDSFDVFSAISQGSFALPKLETSARPQGMDPNELFVDTQQFDKASERGRRNVKKVFDAYKAYLASELARLQKVVDERDAVVAGSGTGKAVEKIIPGTIAELEKRARELQKKLSETLRLGSPEFLKVRDEYLKVSEELRAAQDLLKAPDAQPAANSIAFFEKQVAALREQLNNLPGDAQNVNEVRALLEKAEKDLKALRERIYGGADNSALLLQRLDEEERHTLAMADLDTEAAVNRAKQQKKSDEEIKALEEQARKERLRLEIDFQLRRLAITKASSSATEEETQAQVNALRELRSQLDVPQVETGDGEDSTKKLVENIISASEQIAQAGIDAWGAWSDAAEQSIEAQLQLQQQRVDEAKEIADKGNAAMYEAERSRLNKLTDERRKAAERNSVIAQGEATAAALVAVARAAAEGGGFLTAVTIANALLAMGAGFIRARALTTNAVPSFFRGGAADWSVLGGYTGDGSTTAASTAVGRKPYQYEHREFIMDHVVTGVGNNRTWFDRILRGRLDIEQMMSKKGVVVLGPNGQLSDRHVDRIVQAIEHQPRTEVRLDRDGLSVSVERRIRKSRAMRRRLQ